MPYGVDTIRLRISFPAAPAPQGYDDGMWRMRPLRGWTGGQADAEPPAGAEQGGDGAPDSAGWGGAGGSVTIPISDRIPAASDDPAMPVNPNAKVDALWAERAAITAEMDGLNAGGDYGRAAAELYQRLENRRDIIDANLRSQFNSSLSGTGLQEPGDLEAWLREQAKQASKQPDAYDRMSAEEQRLFIRKHAPDYEIARADETARRYGEAVGGPVGKVLEELGSGVLGVVGGAAGMVGRRGFRGGAGAAGVRNQPGIASQSTPLPRITGPWLRGTSGNAGLVPRQVAEKLEGRTFADFGEFRSAFWQAAADVPELAAQFSKSNLALMKQGKAPVSPTSQHYGMQDTYILHHRNPIAGGGAVYDMSNIVIVTPKMHQSILDPKFHFGGGSQ